MINQEKKKIDRANSTFEAMKEQGRKLQEQRLIKPDAFYTMEFTDVEDQNSKILIDILPDFERESAVLKVSDKTPRMFKLCRRNGTFMGQKRSVQTSVGI